MITVRNLISIALLLFIVSLTCVSGAALNPNLVITPDPLVFADAAPGGTSGPETLRVTNTASSGGGISIESVAVTDDVDFRITSDGCSNRTLGPGNYCDAQVLFAPAGGRGGYFSGFVVFSGGEPAAASLLEGKVVAPVVSFSTTNVAFGNQTVNRSSAEYGVIMENQGDAALAIASITTAAPFAVADNCGTTLNPGATCNIGITFTPTALGSVTGTVTIVSNDPASPATINLSGTGVAPGEPDASLSTGELDFGGQVVNTTSNAMSVILKSVGTVDLTINSITAPAGFASTDDCGATLAPDASCTINVTFSPLALQSYSGNLAIATNAPDSPHNVMLTGIGVQYSGPKAVFSETTIDFGEQALKTPSSPATSTLTNEGDQDLLVSSVTKSTDSSGSFSGDENCSGKTLNSGQSCAINVIFNPQLKGTLSATASVADNSAESPHQLTATGMGVRVSGGCSLVRAPAH